ncbi:MAG: ABC transporter substrate-binding protein [Ectothiorhodospiraceae bacterium]|nr:ABC transporter substrate-binding protein [Chromatiales bacterium]MCP5154561.1 ABC transporter substrate-binding protein [Ectothiorhodospiraceae bacterium]
MTTNLWRILVAAAAVLCATTSPVLAQGAAQPGASKAEFSTTPRAKDGARWRIAYYEGGAHDNYYDYLAATVRGLMELGWVEHKPLPESREKDTRALWRWVGHSVRSDFVEFPDDAYYSANWDNGQRERLRVEVVERLAKRNDVDVIIAMGTWAGKDLANDRHSVPTIVMSTSDPIGSGIIKSVESSGFDHVHARVDPRRYERQVRVFHDLIGFKKLGVMYEDTIYGRTYAAIDLVERVAEERNFEVVRCYTRSDIADQRVAGESVLRCFEELARNADAIYVTQQGGVNPETIPQLVGMANEHRVPTFSQLGSKEVQYGFLLSLSRPSFRPVGLFLAATMAKVMNGARPSQLTQLFEEAPNIAINLKTAELVGLYLYADILAAADEIYREIDQPH